MSDSFTFENTTQAVLPRVDFRVIKDEILGEDYELSFTIVDVKKMKTLNLMYRDKNCATDILSFPLSKNEGEIYICPSESLKEAKKFDRPYDNFIVFLFIHGCTHLKGFDHGGTMERLEIRYRKIFGV
jgi:probable rRNA maturation factor